MKDEDDFSNEYSDANLVIQNKSFKLTNWNRVSVSLQMLPVPCGRIKIVVMVSVDFRKILRQAFAVLLMSTLMWKKLEGNNYKH